MSTKEKWARALRRNCRRCGAAVGRRCVTFGVGLLYGKWVKASTPHTCRLRAVA